MHVWGSALMIHIIQLLIINKLIMYSGILSHYSHKPPCSHSPPIPPHPPPPPMSISFSTQPLHTGISCAIISLINHSEDHADK